MDILTLLALAFFLAAALIAAVRRDWPLLLVSAGLFLLALSGTGLISP